MKKKRKIIRETYTEGYDIYKAAVEQFEHYGDNIEDGTGNSAAYWTARYATRIAVVQMANWIHDTFDLTDEQKEELHSLMCHVVSD